MEVDISDLIALFGIIVSFWYAFVYLCAMAFAVYSFCVFYRMIKEANIACEDDGEKTADLGVLFLLNYVTFGVYSYIWWYKFGKRLAKNAPRYGMDFKNLGRTLLAAKISKGFFTLLFCVAFIFFLFFHERWYAFMMVFLSLTNVQAYFSISVTMIASIVGVVVFHFVLMGIAFKYTNRICAGYNAAHGL